MARDLDDMIDRIMRRDRPAKDILRESEQKRTAQNAKLDALEKRIAAMEEQQNLKPMRKNEMYAAGDEGIMAFSSPEEKRLYELNRRMSRLNGEDDRSAIVELGLANPMRSKVVDDMRLEPAVYRFDQERDSIASQIDALEKNVQEAEKNGGKPRKAETRTPSRMEEWKDIIRELLKPSRRKPEPMLEGEENPRPFRRPRDIDPGFAITTLPGRDRDIDPGFAITAPPGQDRDMDPGFTKIIPDERNMDRGFTRGDETYALTIGPDIDARINKFLKMNGKDPENPERPGAGADQGSGGMKPTLLAAAMPVKTDDRGVT